MQEIEIEFKNMLTKDEYINLKEKLFPNIIPVKQINYYFETTDFQLKQKGAALRIRKKGDQYIATLKEPYRDGLLETHEKLLESDVKEWMNNHFDFSSSIGSRLQTLEIDSSRLKYWGSLLTYRLKLTKNNSIIFLDHSKYNNKEDYEVELEVTNYDEGKKQFDAFLKEYQIPYRPSKNKVQRFFETL